MAVFRIEKTCDYTSMSNYQLNNARSSLKSKDLISMMLSLLNDYNYTIRCLARICKESMDCIRSTRKELESASKSFAIVSKIAWNITFPLLPN